MRQHFQDIGHDESDHDVRIRKRPGARAHANSHGCGQQIGGFIVGTGDLSELALGWATYQRRSHVHYHVNAGVPKTLVRYLIELVRRRRIQRRGVGGSARHQRNAHHPRTAAAERSGNLAQKTEDTIGPYELHDFFLFTPCATSFRRQKIFVLAQQRLRRLCRRNHSKAGWRCFTGASSASSSSVRPCPTAPRSASVALSPRGDWRMPSDASPALWLAEIEEVRAAL